MNRLARAVVTFCMYVWLCLWQFSATYDSADWTGEISKPNVLEIFKGNFDTFQIGDDW